MSEMTPDEMREYKPPKSVTLGQLAAAIAADSVGMDVRPDHEDRALAERLWGLLSAPHSDDNEHRTESIVTPYLRARSAIGFLRSCIRSGEALAPKDEAWLDATLDVLHD